MEIATIATGAATAWLADKAAQAVGIDLKKVAQNAVNDVASILTIPSLPANTSIGRIINTIV